MTEEVEELRRKAEEGDADAQFLLGWKFRLGRDVPQNDAEMVKWCTKAAEQGQADAQYHLGWAHRTGIGAANDADKAVEWYTKSAEQGNKKAQMDLGVMYFYGRDIPMNNREALKWLCKAVKQEYRAAQETFYKAVLKAKYFAVKGYADAQQDIEELQREGIDVEDIIEKIREYRMPEWGLLSMALKKVRPFTEDDAGAQNGVKKERRKSTEIETDVLELVSQYRAPSEQERHEDVP
jgi:hypothetical protein